jgi:hypothetical protein
VLDKENNSEITEAIYELRCPFTSYRFTSPIKNQKIVYYYNVEIKIGKLEDRLSEGIVNIVLSPVKDSIPIYINFIAEVATSIKNGILPMIFAEDYTHIVTDEDIRWFIFRPSIKEFGIGKYEEVKLKWNIEKLRYVILEKPRV